MTNTKQNRFSFEWEEPGHRKVLKKMPITFAFLSFLALLVQFGFKNLEDYSNYFYSFYGVTILVGIISIIGRFIEKGGALKKKVIFMDLFLLLIIILSTIGGIRHFFAGSETLKIHTTILVFVIFLREFSNLKLDFSRRYLNPAQLFIMSFVLIIILGSILLLLPNATHNGISFVDALFTSTSAVCVTGLVVVDTGTYFTSFGQIIIAVLIQIGGIGIMTFASYFSYFFRGGTTYENQLLLKDMTNAQKIAEVFTVLKKIIFITFVIELVGAALIYFSVSADQIASHSERIFFAFFHTISGFCNAGFSILGDSLYASSFRFNYSLHWILAFLFILGGIGFPILFNGIKYLKHLVKNRILPFSMHKQVTHVPWVININTRIVIVTTFILILGGTTLFFLFEYDNTLREHTTFFGKLTTSFFGAVTPRTAGFNSVDMGALKFSTVMLTFLLMWIGASPGSTGGGIKTSTFAIATLNFLSVAKGRKRIEVFKREISEMSTRRAFAIISLSLIVIGTSVFLLSYFDEDKRLVDLAFESFSAYATAGLSLGITSDLSVGGKYVIIATMFVGRVSMLTLLIALMRKVRNQNYKYPKEEILIN